MCGIFGAVLGPGSALRDPDATLRAVDALFRLSESRGKEAAGLAIAGEADLTVHKAAVPARQMIRRDGFRAQVRAAAAATPALPLALIGHSRLVTDGVREVSRNNQPVIAGGIVGIHNGIVVNHAALWAAHPALTRRFEVDSEVIFALVREGLDRSLAPAAAARATFAALEGNASVAALFEDRDELLLATNNGSLYLRRAAGTVVFGSESYILDRFAERHPALFAAGETEHLAAGSGAIVDLATLAVHRFALAGDMASDPPPAPPRARRRVVRDLADADPPPAPPPRAAAPVDLAALATRFPYRSMRDRLRRCVRCVLPETMPFVDFDADGVCAYCRRHRPLRTRGAAALEALVAPHRRTDGRPDCIVGVSGGRDSIYGLHYLKVVLGMNPVAYTYDWGMVTDLARRNVSRICGKLGIEHVLVSADIPRKREYIRKNVEAWLARPTLGTIPLFMAGDKAYFYHLSRVKQQLGVELAFLCENLLERTDFKTGFAGVAPAALDDDHVYTMPLAKKAALMAFYGKEFATNRRYLNASLVDTAKAFAFYYLIDRDYHNLYGYVPWVEEEVASTLLGSYDFERADDTPSLWRIGDGTAAFYNYIYYAIAGMTENDTFRSNQIRNGALDRATALDLIDRDNRPRFPSIQWYLATIGLERTVEEVVAIIEAAPKRYAAGG